MSVDAVGTTRRGRGARKAIRQKRDTNMLPALTRGIPLTEPMSPEQIERIDNASMDILENVGVVFRDEIALADWKRAGADVRGERVHLDRNLVRELIATIPASFTYHARNPDKNLPFGNDHSIFVPMTGAPFLRDLENKRRNPTLDDLADFYKLSHMLPAIHSSAHHIVEPYDPPISQRPFAHHLQLHETLRQDIYGHDNEPQKRRRRDGHVRHPVRARFHDEACGCDRKLQRQLAIGLG